MVRGGTLNSRKGINLPAVNLKAPSLTEKDLADLEFVLDQGVEYVGLSFVRRPDDVIELKKRVAGRALVVAKIEKVQALQAIEEILPETDAVMVARGDLGVELPFERVPLAQKRIVQLANYYGRPVITATQMLESMIEYPRPTRAEASDVANAVLDGTDAVMLSGETAVGDYPLQALGALVAIAREIERSGVLERGPRYITRPGSRARGGATAREHAVAAATVEAARQIMAPAIMVITRSGFTARLVSSYRPPVPVFAVTTDPATYRQLAAVWGVRPVLADVDYVTYEAPHGHRARGGPAQRRGGSGRIARRDVGLPVPHRGDDEHHAPRATVGGSGEAHLPRHRYLVRNPGGGVRLRRVHVVGPAGSAHEARGGRRARRGPPPRRHAHRAPAPAPRGARGPHRRHLVHAHPRRSHPRDRRPAGVHRARRGRHPGMGRRGVPERAFRALRATSSTTRWSR